jgi:type 1 fimbria pilin
MGMNFAKVFNDPGSCIALAYSGGKKTLAGCAQVGVIMTLLLDVGLSAKALADGGVMYFTGGVTAPTCSTQAQALASKVSVRMQCDNSAPITHTLDYRSVANPAGTYVAAVSLQAVAQERSVLLLEYR